MLVQNTGCFIAFASLKLLVILNGMLSLYSFTKDNVYNAQNFHRIAVFVTAVVECLFFIPG